MCIRDRYRGEKVTVQYVNSEGEYQSRDLELPNPVKGEPILGEMCIRDRLDIEQISEALKKDISETKKEVLDLEINGQICLNVDGKYNIKLL